MRRGSWFVAVVAAVCACAGEEDRAGDRGADVGEVDVAPVVDALPADVATASPIPVRDVTPSPSGRLRSAWSHYKPCPDCTTEGSRFLFVWRDEGLVVALGSWTPVVWSPREDVLLVRTAWADDDEFWSLIDCRDDAIDGGVVARRVDLRGHTFHSWSEDGSTIVLQNYFDDTLREFGVVEWLR